MTQAIRFSLNGTAREVKVPAGSRLIDVLREELDATSSKKACGIGRCSACMVLRNGPAKPACS